MKITSSLTPVLAAALLATSAAAADVYVAHGINGTDLGLDEALLVDISVNDGALILDDVPFKASAGPFDLPTGDNTVTISLSDGVAGTADGTVVIDKTINVATFETAVVVAHLDRNSTISLSKFTIFAGDLATGSTRFAVAHAAVAPEVNVAVKGAAKARINQVPNAGQSDTVDGPEGDYNFTIRPSFGKGTFAKLNDVPVAGNVLIVAVGSLANDTFDVMIVGVNG